ncbi:MAG TPA: hypothetical protein PLC98_03640 [Anaerolineales bacterium]|nr:hypothetical protein [Anaerolineales bacterium]
MSTGSTGTQEALQQAMRDRDGWLGTLVRAARRVVDAQTTTEMSGQVVHLRRCVENYDRCAKATVMLQHSLEIEQLLTGEQPSIVAPKAKPRRRRG